MFATLVAAQDQECRCPPIPAPASCHLAPTCSIEITLKDGALYAQATGRGALRLWPESENEFPLKEVNAQRTFVRDAAGVVTGIVLHQGGRDSPGKKIK